jgi:hypothetical protein
MKKALAPAAANRLFFCLIMNNQPVKRLGLSRGTFRSPLLTKVKPTDTSSSNVVSSEIAATPIQKTGGSINTTPSLSTPTISQSLKRKSFKSPFGSSNSNQS